MLTIRMLQRALASPSETIVHLPSGKGYALLGKIYYTDSTSMPWPSTITLYASLEASVMRGTNIVLPAKTIWGCPTERLQTKDWAPLSVADPPQ